MSTYSLLLDSNISGKLLMTTKKHVNLSLHEIKFNSMNHIPIMIVNRRNKEELELMKNLVQVLSTHQSKFRILKQTEDGVEELPLEMFMNSFELSRQIAQERTIGCNIAKRGR